MTFGLVPNHHFFNHLHSWLFFSIVMFVFLGVYLSLFQKSSPDRVSATDLPELMEPLVVDPRQHQWTSFFRTFPRDYVIILYNISVLLKVMWKTFPLSKFPGQCFVYIRFFDFFCLISSLCGLFRCLFLYTPWKFNSSPLKMYHPKRKRQVVFQSSIFRCECCKFQGGYLEDHPS